MKIKQRGFSLVEVMLVMAISVMLGAGGINGWQKWQQQQRLWISVQQVKLLLEQLRSEANWKNTDRLLRLVRSGSSWCLTTTEQANERCENASRQQLKQPFEDVDLAEITAGLGFYGQKSTAWPGHLVLQSPAGEWRIILSAWGRIRLCRSDGENKCS
jgi:prepilin peptidase dependent protein A